MERNALRQVFGVLSSQLVVGIGLIGLAALTPYLDFVLFPTLGFFLILAFYGWWKMKRRSESILH